MQDKEEARAVLEELSSALNSYLSDTCMKVSVVEVEGILGVVIETDSNPNDCRSCKLVNICPVQPAEQARQLRSMVN